MLIMNNLEGVVVCGRDVENAKKKNPLVSSIATEQSTTASKLNVKSVRRNTTMNLGIVRIEKNLSRKIKKESSR
jgi:aspartate oxidase